MVYKTTLTEAAEDTLPKEGRRHLQVFPMNWLTGSITLEGLLASNFVHLLGSIKVKTGE